MLIAGALPWSSVFGAVVALVIGGVGGYYLVKGRKVSAENALADSAVSSLTGELAASNSRIDRLETENRHLEEIKLQQDRTIENLTRRVNELSELVTARDLVEALDKKIERGFLALDVPIDKLRLGR